MFTFSRTRVRRTRNPQYAPEWLESKLSPSSYAVDVTVPAAYSTQPAFDEPPPPPPDVFPPVDPAGPAGPA
ncbi:MAG: hypothetical protein U0835_02075 [Isosphaeraceae bacterium]